MRVINKIEDKQTLNEFENIYKILQTLADTLRKMGEEVTSLRKTIEKIGGADGN